MAWNFCQKTMLNYILIFPGENAIYNAFDWTSASESNSPKSAKHYGASHEDYGFSQYVLPFSNSWVSSRDIFSCKTLLIKAWLIQTWGSKLQSALESVQNWKFCNMFPILDWHRFENCAIWASPKKSAWHRSLGLSLE